MIGEHCDAPDTPQGTIRSPHCFCFAEIRRSRLDGQTPALRAANPTRKQHRGVEPDRCAVSASPRTHMAIFCSEHSQPCEALFSDPFFAGGRPGPLGAPEPLSPRPCPLRCDGAFPEGARLACVASSPPQRPYLVCFQAPLVRWYSGHLTVQHLGSLPTMRGAAATRGCAVVLGGATLCCSKRCAASRCRS